MSDVILSDVPLWMQQGVYPARVDRSLIDGLWSEGIVTGLAVGPRGAGANLSVDVAAGYATVQGDDQSNQGKYLLRLTQTTNMPTLPVPTGGGQKRKDLLVLVAQDPDAGGPVGSNGVLRWVQGTPTTGTPAVPAVPASAVPLANVQLTNASVTVVAGDVDATAYGPAVLRGVSAGSVRAFATAALRDSLWPGAPNGSLAVTLDTNTLWQRKSGAWVNATPGEVYNGFAAPAGGSVTTEVKVCEVLVPNLAFPHRLRYHAQITYSWTAAGTVDQHVRSNLAGTAGVIGDTLLRQSRLQTQAGAGQASLVSEGNLDRPAGGASAIGIWTVTSGIAAAVTSDATLNQLLVWAVAL